MNFKIKGILNLILIKPFYNLKLGPLFEGIHDAHWLSSSEGEFCHLLLKKQAHCRSKMYMSIVYKKYE